MTHDAAVDFFARAVLHDAHKILRELLQANESKVISILTDLNRQRAELLIQPLAEDFSWLADLPKAAADIGSHARATDLVDDQEAVQLKHVANETGWTHAYVRTFPNGVIYWRDDTVCTVSGRIATYHASVGGPDGILGFPLEQKAAFVESRYRTKGTTQRFEDGVVYSSNLGEYAVSEQFSEIYQSLHEAKGWLGFPISPDEPYDDGARIQRFEGGAVFSSAQGTFAVRRPVAECAQGWLPISNEIGAGKSSVSGRAGKMQSFRGTPSGKLVVYSSDSGTYRVGWRMLRYYQAEGGPTSRLGFPMSPTKAVTGRGYTQMFEGGCAYVPLDSRIVFTVPPSTIDELNRDTTVEKRLGWPISEENPIQKSGGYIQFFENGIVTRRSAIEIWLRA